MRSLSTIVLIALITGGLCFGAGPTVTPLKSEALRSVSLLTQADDAFNEADYKKAAAFYEQAVKLQPDNSSAYDGLGRAYERMAESAALPGHLVAKARKNYQKALNLDPKNTAAIEGLIEIHTVPVGVCYGDLNEAAVLVEQLKGVDPALGDLNRFRLEQAIRESRSPEIAARCSYQVVARKTEALIESAKGTHAVR